MKRKNKNELCLFSSTWFAAKTGHWLPATVCGCSCLALEQIQIHFSTNQTSAIKMGKEMEMEMEMELELEEKTHSLRLLKQLALPSLFLPFVCLRL